MTTEETDRAQIIRLCRGNKEAIHWVQIGRRYVHEIDDLIDEDIPKANRISGAERSCRIGILALELYTHPFFLRNASMLGTAMLTNTNNYADSVTWEKSKHQWQAGFSDFGRHGWLDVVLVVAYICAKEHGEDGYLAMRIESAELRALSYCDHHDQKGAVA